MSAVPRSDRAVRRYGVRLTAALLAYVAVMERGRVAQAFRSVGLAGLTVLG